MIPKNAIQCIAFDADDTLWCNENFYLDAEESFKKTLAGRVSYEEISEKFARREAENMEELGYGAKAMTISMIETAIEIWPDIPQSHILDIIETGRKLLRVPTIMLPGVSHTLEALADRFRIIIITKGELNEQTRKFRNAPIDPNIPYFVLPDKHPQTYAALLRRENIDVRAFLMVGNSPRSDVLPPLEIGAWAAHVPYHTTWSHEDVPIPDHPRLLRLKRIEDLIRELT